jgi:heme/copper-type cytochrome/quinol oxidase subunit 2
MPLGFFASIKYTSHRSVDHSDEGVVSTIVHLLLAVILTLFLALQARCLLVVLRQRRATVARGARRRSDLLWTSIPVFIVFFLAVRSWVAVFGLVQPEVASAVTRAEPAPSVRAALLP